MKKILVLVLLVVVTAFIASSTMKVSSDNDFVRANASLLVEGDVGDVEVLLMDYRNGEEEALSKMFRAFHSSMGPAAYEHHVRMLWATQCPERCSECEDFLEFCSEFDIR